MHDVSAEDAVSCGSPAQDTSSPSGVDCLGGARRPRAGAPGSPRPWLYRIERAAPASSAPGRTSDKRVVRPRLAIMLGGLRPRPRGRPTVKALIRGRDTVLGTHRRTQPDQPSPSRVSVCSEPGPRRRAVTPTTRRPRRAFCVPAARPASSGERSDTAAAAPLRRSCPTTQAGGTGSQKTASSADP